MGIDGNAIEAATTINMDTIAKDHSYRTLLASGTSVGLSEGLMGNSEVGYVLINLQLGFLGIAFWLCLIIEPDFYRPFLHKKRFA